LVLAQQEVCRKNPESLLCISEGAKRGIMECQQQFKFERWNCTTNAQKVFGPVLRRGEKTGKGGNVLWPIGHASLSEKIYPVYSVKSLLT
jgi:hypothetical protein